MSASVSARHKGPKGEAVQRSRLPIKDEQSASAFVSSNDIEKLYHHFLRIDTDASGTIERSELLALPGNAENPLASRILETFDTNGDGRVDFGEFVNGLAVFSGRGSRDSKIRFAFNVYDLDKDGYISNGELFLSLKIMSGEHLEDTHLQQIVDKTIRDADKDGDGRISFAEFKHLVLSKNAAIFDKWSLQDL